MKKILATIMLSFGIITASAADYSYLTFETTDGGKVSVSVASLTLTISGTTLTAGSQSFTLTNLSKMYFSTSDETSTTGIGELTNVSLDEATDIYDLQGKKVTRQQMRKGAYIVKTNQGTHKIIVK